MLTYIIRRLLQVPFIIIGVMLLTFVLFRSIGDNPAYRIAGKNANPRRIAEISHLNGYNKPLVFGNWGAEIPLVGNVKGVTTTKVKERQIVYKLNPPTDINKLRTPTVIAGTLTVPIQVMDPDYGKQYRLQFGLETPQGGEVRIFREWSGVKGEPRELVLEQTLSSGKNKIVADIKTPPQEPPPAVITADNIPTRLAVKYILEFEGEEGTLSNLKLSRHQSNPFDAQLWEVIGKLSVADFGESKETKQRVSKLFAAGILPSLTLTVPALLLNVALAISIALFCAYYRNSPLDRVTVVFAVMGMSIPVIIYCILMQSWTADKLQYLGLPVWGFESWRNLLLPLGISVIAGLGGGLRFNRTLMLNERYSDYVRTATAKGCSESAVLFRHILKNAMITIITNLTSAIAGLYVGALLFENFFGIPGVGWLTTQAIPNGDEPVLFAAVFVGSIVFVFANLAADISYALFDPRVRLK